MNPAENYILKQPEPYKTILLELQILIESTIPELELNFKWKLPYYYLLGKPFCFLNATKGYVDLAFRNEKYLKKFSLYFVTENRKSFASLRYFKTEDIDSKVLIELLRKIKEGGYNGYWNKKT